LTQFLLSAREQNDNFQNKPPIKIQIESEFKVVGCENPSFPSLLKRQTSTSIYFNLLQQIKFDSTQMAQQDKERILKYLESQLSIQEGALIQEDSPANKNTDNLRCLILRHDITELKKHIELIQML